MCSELYLNFGALRRISKQASAVTQHATRTYSRGGSSVTRGHKSQSSSVMRTGSECSPQLNSRHGCVHMLSDSGPHFICFRHADVWCQTVRQCRRMKRRGVGGSDFSLETECQLCVSLVRSYLHVAKSTCS